MEKHTGVVPSTFEELEALPGMSWAAAAELLTRPCQLSRCHAGMTLLSSDTQVETILPSDCSHNLSAGVGHKTASVVMAQAFGHDAFPVDTHIHRLAQRWGLTSGTSVEQTEADLKALLPPSSWRDAHLQVCTCK
jgi:endonuclease-3